MSGSSLPPWAEWQSSGEPFSVGLEEEVMLLDPDSWGLTHSFQSVHPRLSSGLGAQLSLETHAAAIELESRPHLCASDAADELAALRARLVAELAEHDLAAAGAGTHPFATWEETAVSTSERYQLVHETMRELARREPTFALHVHVAIPSPAEAISAFNRLRAAMPLLLALSANSPYWHGRDSGLASARTPIFHAFPRVGIPRNFDSYRHYVAALDTLIKVGAFPEPTFVWWDLRLQPRFGTVEVRIMDTQTESWRTAALASLVQALVRLEASEGYAPNELVEAREVLEENRFLASRDGVRAELIDPSGPRMVPVAEQLEALIESCAPHAAELGCSGDLERTRELISEPADEGQRRLAGDTGDLRAVAQGLSAGFAKPARASTHLAVRG